MQESSDSMVEKMVIVEAAPGIGVAFGDIPAELKPALLDFGFLPPPDRERLSVVLGAIANAATVAGNLANALAGAQGVFRIAEQSQAVLNAGGVLVVKDGANLGAVMRDGRIIHQARFVPMKAVSMAQTAAALGPALAMIGLQMQLSEVAGLVHTNVALTSQVLDTILYQQWAELTGLVATIDNALDRAREAESIPTSLWERIAASEASLRTQREQYRLKVGDHVRKIRGLDGRGRSEHLERNAEAIVFDAHALLVSLKAWTGYEALAAARTRSIAPQDEGEARLIESTASAVRAEFDAALAETTSLVGALTRELRFIELFPGREPLQLPGKRRDSSAARETATRLLEAIGPLAHALRPPAPPIEEEKVVGVRASLALKPYLDVLPWFLEDGESVRVIGFPEQTDDSGTLSTILGGAKEMLGREKPSKALVVVTDRRVITAKANAFLEQGEIGQAFPIDQVRYVRAASEPDKSGRLAIDLITRDENLRWLFEADIDGLQVYALAAVLAESMNIPEIEREALRRQNQVAVEAGENHETTE